MSHESAPNQTGNNASSNNETGSQSYAEILSEYRSGLIDYTQTNRDEAEKQVESYNKILGHFALEADESAQDKPVQVGIESKEGAAPSTSAEVEGSLEPLNLTEHVESEERTSDDVSQSDDSTELPKPERPNTLGLANSREVLTGSRYVRQLIREKANNGVFDVVGKAHDKLEDKSANRKHRVLSRKQKSLQRQYDRFDHLAKSTKFGRLKEYYEERARGAKRHLDNTTLVIANNSAKYGERDEKGHRIEVTDDNGKLKEARVDKQRNRIQLERAQWLEKRRILLLEKQIVANEKKQRRKQDEKAQQGVSSVEDKARIARLIDQQRPSMKEFKKILSEKLTVQLNERMAKLEAEIMAKSTKKPREKSDDKRNNVAQNPERQAAADRVSRLRSELEEQDHSMVA